MQVRVALCVVFAVEVGNVIQEGHPLVFVEQADVDVEGLDTAEDLDLDLIRGDLQETMDRRKWIYGRESAESHGTPRANRSTNRSQKHQ